MRAVEKENQKSLQLRYLWIFTFCFATVTSLLFQKFLLPMLPSLHAGYGLFAQDAVHYHLAAIAIADDIRTHGWDAWSIWPAQARVSGVTGNVSVLAALYAAFSPDPGLIIPVNAFFQATSACLLLLIGRELWPGRTGNIAGLVAAVLFTVFPSSLSWYGQPLKDCYVICGVLLILYSWLRAFRTKLTRGKIVSLLAQMVAGTLLVAFVKPYYLKLLLLAGVLVTCIAAIYAFRLSKERRYRMGIFYASAIMLVFVILKAIQPFTEGRNEQYAKWEPATTAGASSSAKAIAAWQWENSSWLPTAVESGLETVARTRAGMIAYNLDVGAASVIDEDRAPQSSQEIISYLPRALQVALFSPFPDTWLQKPSLIRLVGVCETALWYLVAPGLLLALYYRRTVRLAVAVVFASFFMTVLSFVTPNVGTLYRFRYAYEFVLMVIAIGGWVHLYLNSRWGRGRRQSRVDNDPEVLLSSPPIPHSGETKKSLINAATAVSLLTLAGTIGFFMRDLLMARWFGMSGEMDAFFLGAMIPMFLVSVLSMPAGTAMIPFFSMSQERGGRGSAIGSAMLLLSTLLAAVSVALYFLGPYVFSMLGWDYSAEKLAAIREITNIYLLILLFSGWVITANAALNSEGRAVFPAMAQLVAPVVVLLALVFFGRSYGIYAAAYGMLAGQVVNLALVMFALRRAGIGLALPQGFSAAFMALPLRQYALLVATALSTALFIPVANAIAADLPEGSVAIVGLGMKVVLLVTGVIGMGMTTVLLPYFSGLAARLLHQQARTDLSFFLLFVTLLSVPATLILTVLVEPVTRMIFSGSALTEADIQSLCRVIQYGLIQLPFFTCGLVAIKYIIAYRGTWAILLSSVVGLALAIVLGKVFSRAMGVGGISLAMTLSMAISTALLVSYANYLKHLPVSDSMFIVFNWAIFITLLICLHYQVYIGIVISSGAYLLLVASNLHAVIAHAYGWAPSFRYWPKSTGR